MLRHRSAVSAALRLTSLCLALIVVCHPLAARADTVLRTHNDATDRIIVKWRDSGVAAMQIASVQDRTARLAGSSGIALIPVRNIHDSLDVMRMPTALSGDRLRAVIARLRADPSVEYAEPDGHRYVQATVNDPRFVAGSDAVGSWTGQWYLLPSSSSTPAAIGATTAWDTTMGSASVVVAVIDTGVRLDHEDLQGKLYPGYDFVGCDQGESVDSNGYETATCSVSGSAATYVVANDGGVGWNSDPSDPGDWISSTDLTTQPTETVLNDNGCTSSSPSTWHGTRVAGIIGAIANNNVGIAGTAPSTMILPVRAIGKCVGYLSDVVVAMRWAAGLSVTGAPANPYPAQIINLSLADATACSTTEQDTVDDINAQNVLIVAAAGNEGGPVDAPANCTGVLSVAGIRHDGSKVGFSNLSSAAAAIGIAAPGGNCVNLGASTQPYFVSPGPPCVYSIETLSNASATTPAAGSFYTYALFNADYATYTANVDNVGNVGTSFAAPLVSGVAALMLAANSALTASELMTRLESSALAFPSSSSSTTTACALAATTTNTNNQYTDTSQDNPCLCTTATCGAGMLNAASAVQTAVNADVTIAISTDGADPGQRVTLNGGGSTARAGNTISAYQWTASPSISIENANSAVAQIVFPAFRSISVTLTITDNTGAQTSGTAVVLSKLAAATGGGGGAFGWELSALALLAAWRVRRRYWN
jgi:serine protease